MGLSATIKEWYLKSLPGMNNLTEDLDLQEKWVEVAQNCRFEEEPGAVDKRTPVTYFNSTTLGAGAYGITGLYRFYTSDGTSVFVCVHDTSAYVNSDSTGAGIAIRTGLTAGKRASFVTYRDILIGSNGFDNMWCYDGSDDVTWELGSCKAVVSASATGSLDASAAYSYQVAITVSGATHICGAISNAVSSGTAKCINLSNIPLGPSGATNRLLYRTEGDADPATHGNFKLLATLSDNTTVIYTDTIGDGSLGAAVGVVTDDQPKGAELRIHRERLFVSRDPDNPNKIYYSDPWLPHFIQQTTNLTYMEISPEDGDEIAGIPIQLGTMVCIKKNTIRKLHITSAVSGADPTTWYADDPIAWNGCPAPWSITQTPYGIVFLGWDHWYLFDGAAANLIIDEFDTKDILPAGYQDVVGFYHKGIMLAAYADKIIANQFHDRIMRYNFKRKTLSYDLWTGDNISGANCFTAKTGDDETGELYYGDSQKAYILKDKESERYYRLRTKTECLLGTANTVFIGGTETAPYLEVGSTTSASTIPDGIVIFWDDAVTTPGAGWSEITSTYNGKFIAIAASSSTSAAVSHTHSISGSLSSVTPGIVNGGDNDSSGGLLSGHGHSYSITSSSSTAEPRNIMLRMFESSSCTTTEFPDGAIVMWDQETAPTGWQSLSNVGYYVKAGTAGLNTPSSGSHSHTYSGTSSSGPGDSGASVGGSNGCHGTHAHTLSNTTGSASLDTWELDYAQIHMIKKVGESDSWDGTDKYVMCLATGTPSGWTAVSTYNGKYLKVGAATASTGAAASAAHTHSTPSGTSSSATVLWGGTYYVTQIRDDHTHSYGAGSTDSGDAGAPSTVSLMLFKFVLGKMKNYNAAITVSATGGNWVSPTMEIKSETLSQMFWNEDIDDPVNDDVKFYMKTGATSTACAASTAWSTVMTNPNGSTIDATADEWAQYKIDLTCADSTASNPRVYFSDGYVVKYTYLVGATNAETSVNWLYKVGFRNFGEPFVDKIFKKITAVYEGEEGSLNVKWETENTSTSSTFIVDLTSLQERWDSFFPSTAMGKEINLEFSKNDLYDFRLKEVKGLYSPMPVIL